jgi:hypothetical protein
MHLNHLISEVKKLRALFNETNDRVLSRAGQLHERRSELVIYTSIKLTSCLKTLANVETEIRHLRTHLHHELPIDADGCRLPLPPPKTNSLDFLVEDEDRMSDEERKWIGTYDKKKEECKEKDAVKTTTEEGKN